MEATPPIPLRHCRFSYQPQNVYHHLAGHGLNYATIFSNEDKFNPMTCGTFTIKSSKATTFDYTCSKFILVLGEILNSCVTLETGEIRLEDKAKLQVEQIKNLKAGDCKLYGSQPYSDVDFTSPNLDDKDARVKI
ncbi:hypothetical protein BYT27DRAFT_7215016 [Phlegmacium glaucopus]|nr:hypothetical protein BYT27DRAFT_7215016 [Phlegmacium glaucopus]